MYALLRTRDMAISRYREYGIPTDWLLDSGIVGKVCMIYIRLTCHNDFISRRDAPHFVILQTIT